MVFKSKKKSSKNRTTDLKSKKKQQYGGGASFTTFGNLKYGTEVTASSLQNMKKLQDASKDASLVISALEAPNWGSSKGASSYKKIKNNLMSIRNENIDAMKNITSILSKPSVSEQRKAISEIKKLEKSTNTYLYQSVLQSKRDIESSFKNVSVPRKKGKSELFNTVSQRVHLTRSAVLLDFTTLVRTETLKINSMLSTVINDKGSESLRDTDSSQ